MLTLNKPIINNTNLNQLPSQSIQHKITQQNPILQPTPYHYILKLLNKHTQLLNQSQQKQLHDYQIPKTSFYESLALLINKQFLNLRVIKDFFKNLNQQKNCHINLDSAMRHLDQIEFIVSTPIPNQKKLETFDNQKKRGYVLAGKAVSVYKRTKKNANETLQDRQARDQLTQQLQRGIFRLHSQQKLLMQKWQKNLSVSDFLMQFDLPNSNIQPVFISNQVFSPFITVQPSIIMIIPQKLNTKPQNIQFLKSSMLHSYIDQAQLISRISNKIILRKNATIKGVVFIQQGEVQVTSGRVVARGWITNGVCRNSGVGWKFKPMNFVKFIAKHQNVWKQYLNDIKNNGQYPYDMNSILDVQQEGQQDQYSASNYKGYTKKLKLPKITTQMNTSKSFDYGKYVQIQKLRHYDDKINDMCYYKNNILMRKLKGVKHNDFKPLIENQQMEIAKKARLKRQMSKQRKYFATPKRSFDAGSQNILIMSVLKRLQSLAGEQNEDQYQNPTGNYRYSKNQSQIFNNKNKINIRSISKITPLQMYENRKKNAKSYQRYAQHH